MTSEAGEPVAGPPPELTAAWALWGRRADDTAPHVLACSSGPLTAGDFRGVVERYAAGLPDRLPQYTLFWIPGAAGTSEFVGIAIHEHASYALGDIRDRYDASGREIVYIRLFCVRYEDLATHRATFTGLLSATERQKLPPQNPASPLTLRMDPGWQVPDAFGADPRLAATVAVLLLTARPVCILGAGDVSAFDRLAFIDQVLARLPYGLRATLSASTWASATAQDLKLRLFFTNAERDDDGVTTHVTWNRLVPPDLSAPEHMPLRQYRNWLEHDGADAAAELAGQTAPVRFTPDEIRQLLAGLPTERPVADILEALADAARRGRLSAAQASVRRLGQRKGSSPSPAQREEYRQAIKRLGLFKDHPQLDPDVSASVYRVLLALAFGPSISYGSFCEIEDCVGGPPGRALAGEMVKLAFSSFFPWCLTGKSAAGLTDKELMDALHQQGIPATAPVMEFRQHAGEARPAHRQALCDFAVGYLRAYAGDPKAELARLGYLAETLEAAFPYDRRAQRSRLKETLVFVHGGLLSEKASAALLSQPGVPRTRALESAVAELTDRPGAGVPPGAEVPGTRHQASGTRVQRDRVALSGRLAVVGLGVIATAMLAVLIYVLS